MDAFNAGGCELFYSMAPNRTVAQKRLPGRKKAKERILIISCANTEGLEKIKLMIIGSSWKPRAFKKDTGAQLGFYYHANKKSEKTAEFST